MAFSKHSFSKSHRCIFNVGGLTVPSLISGYFFFWIYMLLSNWSQCVSQAITTTNKCNLFHPLIKPAQPKGKFHYPGNQTVTYNFHSRFFAYRLWNHRGGILVSELMCLEGSVNSTKEAHNKILKNVAKSKTKSPIKMCILTRTWRIPAWNLKHTCFKKHFTLPFFPSFCKWDTKKIRKVS